MSGHVVKPPDDIPPFLGEILTALGSVGTPLLVGGCVRDRLMELPSKDFDIEVYSTTGAAVAAALSRFGDVDPVGKSFGVIKLRRDGIEYDISLPRTERKTGTGHRGFEVGTDPNLKPAEALARRDFTINAMALDAVTGELIDPHGGRADLKDRLLRHTSAAFTEDPLRVLRAFQFAGRLDFRLDPETARLCASISNTFGEIPVERVWGEWAKWASDSIRPSAGLRVLEQTGWLRHFSEIEALRGLQQEPEWHPEGDVFEHTCCCVDALAELGAWRKLDPDDRQMLMLAVLSHDFGKATTTIRVEKHGKERWTSPGHEIAGGLLAGSFLHGIGSPKDLIEGVRPLVENHHTHYHGTIPPSPPAVRRLARRLSAGQPRQVGGQRNATLAQWLLVLRSDHLGRPPLISQETEERIEAWARAAQELELERSAPRPILLGRHLIEAGMAPGPAFKPLLDEAFEAQLDGSFSGEPGARDWLMRRIAVRRESPEQS